MILEATEFATERYARGKQPFRKYTNPPIPYIVHPLRVARRVHEKMMPLLPYADVRRMVIAAILHDILEDTDTQIEELTDRFGHGVADLVLELTDVYTDPKRGNRATRKAWERERLAKVSYHAQCIKLADLEDNTASIVPNDPGFAKVYVAEKIELLKVMTKPPGHWRSEVIGHTVEAWSALYRA